MAVYERTNRGIEYNTDGNDAADVLRDMQHLAETTDTAIDNAVQEATYDDTSVKTRLKTAEDKISNIEAEQNTQNTNIDANASAINALEGIAQAQGQTLEQHTTEIDTTNQNVTNLMGRVSTNETNILNIKAEQTTQNNNISELQENVEQNINDIEALEEGLNTANTNINNKVDKVQGKGLSTEDFTTAKSTKLDGIAAGAQVNVLENLTLGGQALTKNNKSIEIKDPEVTDARASTIKNKTFASVDARIEELEADVDKIETTRGHVYGIRRKMTSNSSSTWERLFDSVGKVANATKNGTAVQNDFDNLAPWSEIKTCNYDLTTKKINAWFGDANFKFDGTNGDVFTHIPKTYWKIYQEDDYEYILLADYPKVGFTEIDGFFVGRYNGSVVADDGKLHTYSGLIPTVDKNISQFRTLANALGSNFSQLDWRYFVLQMLYLVEYANYNSQSMLGNGVQSRKNLKALIAETNTNRAVVSNSTGYYVGQVIRIGTYDGGANVASPRKITAIEAYNDGTITGYALTFDSNPVNVAVDNIVTSQAQMNGQCDELGMKSGCLNNDGYHSMIYRGVENLFANIWQFVDGINIKDHLAYICKDHSQYASNVFEEPYKPLSYTNCEANGYAKTLGFDENEPFFRFPTEIGGATNTYMSDYYYQNTGNRVALVGGGFVSGADDGLWYWYFGHGSSFAYWSFGCRVLIDNQ